MDNNKFINGLVVLAAGLFTFSISVRQQDLAVSAPQEKGVPDA